MKAKFQLRAIEPAEKTILNAILRYLEIDERVAWAHRFNTGSHVVFRQEGEIEKKRRYIRYAFPGCSDILGQLKDGRFLAVECKSKSGKVSADQQAFLNCVKNNNGVAVVARSIDDVKTALEDISMPPEHGYKPPRPATAPRPIAGGR